MKLIIHRGTREIGGTCLEFAAGKTRLLFDFGLPLESMQDNKPAAAYALAIKGVYKEDTPKVSAVFITHAHPDHYGMLELINPAIPVYMSAVSEGIIKKVSPLFGKNNFGHLNTQIISPGAPVTIGPFEITAFPVDHSAAQALAFQIKYKDKTIIYTGDIRFCGRTAFYTKSFIKKSAGADYLIIEGTSLGRTEKENLTEADIEEKLSLLFADKTKLPLISFSSQNLDRVVSVYKAALRTKRTLVIDPYTAFVLEVFGEISSNIPQFSWNNIAVYFAPNSISSKLAEDKRLYKYKSKKITFAEILAKPQNFIIKDNFKISSALFKTKPLEEMLLVWSQWAGYLDNPKTLWHKYKKNILHVHSSGHADVKTLCKIVKAISPKHIIPVHTENGDVYKNFFGSKVMLLTDAQILKI